MDPDVKIALTLLEKVRYRHVELSAKAELPKQMREEHRDKANACLEVKRILESTFN
jgi:hypothetical protein